MSETDWQRVLCDGMRDPDRWRDAPRRPDVRAFISAFEAAVVDVRERAAALAADIEALRGQLEQIGAEPDGLRATCAQLHETHAALAPVAMLAAAARRATIPAGCAPNPVLELLATLHGRGGVTKRALAEAAVDAIADASCAPGANLLFPAVVRAAYPDRDALVAHLIGRIADAAKYRRRRTSRLGMRVRRKALASDQLLRLQKVEGGRKGSHDSTPVRAVVVDEVT
ncbi:hypothetical protein [Luteitalea sp.]